MCVFRRNIFTRDSGEAYHAANPRDPTGDVGDIVVDQNGRVLSSQLDLFVRIKSGFGRDLTKLFVSCHWLNACE